MAAYKIALAGPSGLGKSTLATQLANHLGIPFRSGSYRDLNENYKSKTQVDMITMSPDDIFRDDYQLLNLRRNLFRDSGDIISDRSFLDSAAYLIQKLSHQIKQCDTETFIGQCQELTVRMYSHMIFLPLMTEYLNEWKFEDDGKRVTNRYFQWQMSLIMRGLLEYWSYKPLRTTYSYEIGDLTLGIQSCRVLILPPEGEEWREKTAVKFIKNEL